MLILLKNIVGSIMKLSRDAVKQNLENLVGKDVDLVVNKGRKKIIKFNAKILNVYPSMFVISPNESVDLDRTSYHFVLWHNFHFFTPKNKCFTLLFY